MKALRFLKQYVSKPRSVGAVLPSSKNLANKMIEDIKFENAKCIVEFGPGTGIFTEKLIGSRAKDTVLIIMETNEEFYNDLKNKYKNQKNMYIINDSAEKIGDYLKAYNIDKADYIISGLPFASLPKNISKDILSNTNVFLKESGSFILFQYTMLKKDFIESFFNIVKVKKSWINIPPAYVLICKSIS